MPMHLDILSNTYLSSRKRAVQIDRPVFTEDDLTHLYHKHERGDKPSVASKIKKKVEKCCSKAHLIQGLISLFPVISWLPKYNLKSDLVRDLTCGLTLGIIQIPQGMAYGMLTTLPAIFGLYASLIPVFVYFFFGTSKHLNIGTFAIICLMVGEVVESNVSPLLPLQSLNSTTADEMEEQIIKLRVDYAVTASFLVGVLQVAFGFLRFGFITIFLSDPLISGFTTGAAFHVFSSQVKHLVGMRIPREKTSGVFGLFKLYIYIFENIKKVNYGALIIGVIAAVILYVIKYFAQKYKEKVKFPIPAELIVVILGTGLSYGFHFETKYNIPILSDVPTGMPPISIPMFSKMSTMVVDCLSIAIVSYAISVSVAKAFAKKNKYEIDANQELFAHGAVNIVGSFLSCFVASGSLSRSLIQENLGSTQFAAVFSCVLIILTLTVLAPLVEPLPNAILSAIVLIALKGLFKQFSVLKDLIKISKIDAFVWVASFIAVFCLGVDYGLAVGLVVNLLTTVLRTSRPSIALLGHVPDTEIYASVNPRNQLALEELHGIKIFQFHAPLLYINVDHFQESLFKATVNPTDCISVPVPKCYQLRDKLILDTDNEFFMESDDSQRHRSASHITTPRDPTLIKRSGSLDSPHRFRCKSVNIDSTKDLFCPLHTVILDCSQISYADTMGIGKLVSVCSEYKNLDVDIHLCNTPSALLDLLDVGGFIEMHGSDNIFVSVHDAVQYSLTKQHTIGICSHSFRNVVKDSSYQLVSVDEPIYEDGECSSSVSSKENV